MRPPPPPLPLLLAALLALHSAWAQQAQGGAGGTCSAEAEASGTCTDAGGGADPAAPAPAPAPAARPRRPPAPTASEHLLQALRRDQARWKPGRVVPAEFWASSLPKCSDGHVCPGPDFFCCAADFPQGMAGKQYRADMCCPSTPTSCPTRTVHKKHCLTCNRLDWVGECPYEGCVSALPVDGARALIDDAYAEHAAAAAAAAGGGGGGSGGEG
jgi:hypothetical protein